MYDITPGPDREPDSGEEGQSAKPRRRGIFLLPNLFTTGALFAGFFAIVQAMNGRFEMAAVAIFIAMILDGLDGRVARMTNTQSAFGAEYDSLSDMVSFGVAPALVMYSFALKDMGKLGWIAAFVFAPAPPCAWPASTPCWRCRTSAGSWACPARRRPPWWRASSGSWWTTTSRATRCAGWPGASPCSPASA
jgi:hypothetical protein